jgi:hypothetical protein
MSQIITHNAHARSHANSELPKDSPREGCAASRTRGHGSAPIPLFSQQPIPPIDPDRHPKECEGDNSPGPSTTTFPAPPDPVDNEGHGNEPESPPHRKRAGGPAGPDGELNPSDDGSIGRPDGDNGGDRYGQDRDEHDNEEPFWTRRGSDNVTVQDLLCLLGPILTECRGPVPALLVVTPST